MLTVTCHLDADLLNISNIREVLDETWKYRARWRFIGIRLGIDTGTLDAIEADHRKVEDCLRKLINIWLKDVSPRPTRTAMKAALRSESVLCGAGNYVNDIYYNTVKPPNNGHIGGRSLVHCREVVLISEVR